MPEPFINDPDFRLYVGDVRDVLATLPDESIDCCITSPPYYGLRDYGTGTWEGGDPGCDHVSGPARQDQERETPGGRGGSFRGGNMLYRDLCEKCGAERVDQQIGLEDTLGGYIDALVGVLREVRRTLTPYGTLWLNLGDSYVGALSQHREGGSAGDDSPISQKHLDGIPTEGRVERGLAYREDGLKQKDLVMVPARVALALQADGWYVRSDIIWAKPNPMPESVTDRPTKSHEFVFMLAKSDRYYFDQDAVREPHGGRTSGNVARKLSTEVGAPGGRSHVGRSVPWTPASGEPDPDVLTIEGLPPEAPRAPDGRRVTTVQAAGDSLQHRDGERWPNPSGRNARSVWEIAVAYEDAAAWLAEVFANAMRAGELEVATTVWEIATKPYKGAHFATYPPELVRRCLLAGCPEQVCVKCGRPRERIVADVPVDPDLTQVGWTDCGCAYGLPADSLEEIETPTGSSVDEDPTLDVGRKGLARPRGDDEGVRTITRFEQRSYAEQLRDWHDAAREELCDEFGITTEAWAHYVRTDRSGGRPLPADALDTCLARGWLDPPVLPERIEGTYRPGVVLDPFMGSGTTALVARDHGRHAVGVELNPEYAELCARRVGQLSLLALTPA